MTILELREKRAKAWEATKAFLDSHRNDKGMLSAEDDATYSRMEQEITDLGKEIARLERQEALDAEPHEDPAPSAGQQSAPVTVLNFPVQRDEAAAAQEDETPVSTQDQAETPPPAAPSYTDDMSVEEICQVMTLEEAGAIVVPSGPNKGSTMAQLAERRPSSLRFFMTPFYKCSNSQKAAATLLIQELDQKIAG